MIKKNHKYNMHLTFDERIIIQIGIENQAPKKATALTLGRDATTIAKEIKRNRIYKPPRHNGRNKTNQMTDSCNYRDRSPGACNGCPAFSHCKKTRYYYDAKKADDQYRLKLVSSREGIIIDEDKRRCIGKVLQPLIEKKQSLTQILINHPEIDVSLKTLYNYIDKGVFRDYGIINLSLKERVNRKLFKQRYKKRKTPASYKGHTYDDYLQHKLLNQDKVTVEMDTLYNEHQGPYLQTLIFTDSRLVFGFLHDKKTCESMVSGITRLETLLGDNLFAHLFGLILTDRGTEFETHRLFEYNDKDEKRTGIFYCDPMCAHQKPFVENNHNYVRDIIPNNYDMNTLDQNKVDIMFSHINSTPRISLGNKSPIELFEFLHADISNTVLKLLNIYKIHYDEVTLSPSILK